MISRRRQSLVIVILVFAVLQACVTSPTSTSTRVREMTNTPIVTDTTFPTAAPGSSDWPTDTPGPTLSPSTAAPAANTWPTDTPGPTLFPTTAPQATLTSAAPPAPLAIAWGVRTKTSGCMAHGALPDPACTPGNIFPNTTVAQVCVPGYSATVRDVSVETKSLVYAEYEVEHHVTGDWEVDHLIPLSIAGSNDISNLWPEPASPTPGFHQKDDVELYVLRLVCAGSLPLADAQRAVATNWLAVYAQMTGAAAGAPVAAQSTNPAALNTPPASGADTQQLISLTSPVARGATASIQVRTTPGASCSISVIYKGGPSKAKGLSPITASADGICAWSWVVGPSTTPGTWQIVIQTNSVTQSYPFEVR